MLSYPTFAIFPRGNLHSCPQTFMSTDINVCGHDNTAYLVLGTQAYSILHVHRFASLWNFFVAIMQSFGKSWLKDCWNNWTGEHFALPVFTIDQLALLHAPDRVNSFYRELTTFGRDATVKTETQYLFPGDGERSNLLNIRFANVLSISLQLSCNS